MKDIEQILVDFDYMENQHVHFYSNPSVFVECYCWDFNDVWFNSDRISVKDLVERFECIHVLIGRQVVYSEGW